METNQAVIHETIENLRLAQPVFVEQHVSLHDAIQLMQNKKVGCLPVCKDLHLVGIFTERDVLFRILNNDSVDYQTPIREWMTPDPMHAHAHYSIQNVIELMASEGIRHVPVVDKNGHLKAVVSALDIVDFLVQYHPDHVFNLPPNLKQVHQTVEGG